MLMDPATRMSGTEAGSAPGAVDHPAFALGLPMFGAGGRLTPVRTSSGSAVGPLPDAASVVRPGPVRRGPSVPAPAAPGGLEGYPPYHPLLPTGERRVVNALPPYQRGWPSGTVRWPEVLAGGLGHGVHPGDPIPDVHARYAEVHPDLGSLSLGTAVGTFREGTPWASVWPALDYSSASASGRVSGMVAEGDRAIGRLGDFNRVSGGLGQSLVVGGSSEPVDLRVLAYVWMPDATGSLPRRGEEEVPFLLRPGQNEMGGLVGVRGEVELEVHYRSPAGAERRVEPAVARARRTVLDACAWREGDGSVRTLVHSDRTATLLTELRAPTPLHMDVFLTVTLWAYRVGDPTAPAGSSEAPSGWALVDCAWNRLGVDRARVAGGIHPRVGDVKVSGFMVEVGEPAGD